MTAHPLGPRVLSMATILLCRDAAFLIILSPAGTGPSTLVPSAPMVRQ